MGKDDLIRRSALKVALLQLAEKAEGNIALLVDVNDLIRDAPAVDPESLRARGEWQLDKYGGVIGSCCGYCAAIGGKNALHNARKAYNFCPNCGARMGSEAQ